MDRRPLDRLVRWQPDCAAAWQDDNAGLEEPQQSGNGCGLRTTTEPLASTPRMPQPAPCLMPKRWTVLARGVREANRR